MKNDEPKLEINKPSNQKSWQKQGVNLWLYIIFMMASLYLWQGFKHVQKEEIPYSEFLQKMQKGDIEEAVVSGKIITGKFRQPNSDTDTGTEKPHYFITVPLFNNELANELEKNGVEYTVRQGDNWLSTFLFSWVLPFGFLFLIWNWMAKRMGGRIAGELVIEDASSGASNDLERASEIAHEMITRLGMSNKLGPLTYGKRQQLMYLGIQGAEEINYSEETSRLFDEAGFMALFMHGGLAYIYMNSLFGALELRK